MHVIILYGANSDRGQLSNIATFIYIFFFVNIFCILICENFGHCKFVYNRLHANILIDHPGHNTDVL